MVHGKHAKKQNFNTYIATSLFSVLIFGCIALGLTVTSSASATSEFVSNDELLEVSDTKIDYMHIFLQESATDISTSTIEYLNVKNQEMQEALEQERIAAEQAAQEEYYEEYYYYAPVYYNRYNNDFQSAGVVYDDEGTRYTWYSQNVLPGGGLTELNNNGRHVDDEGFIRDGDGYIAVASSDHEMGEVVNTPWGEAKVYDTGCSEGTIDVYTDF